MWERRREEIVLLTGTYYAKLVQNSSTHKRLLDTRDRRILAEASPLDPLWGIGYLLATQNSVHPSRWTGKNNYAHHSQRTDWQTSARESPRESSPLA